MFGFTEVFAALKQGKRVKRNSWDGNTALFVRDGQMIWESYGRPGHAHQLDWDDINASDWQIL